MNFDYSEKVLDLMSKLNAFMDENIYPNEAAYAEHFKTTEEKWMTHPQRTSLITYVSLLIIILIVTASCSNENSGKKIIREHRSIGRGG